MELKEAETIQKNLRVSNAPSTIAEMSKKFTHDMGKGNINSTMITDIPEEIYPIKFYLVDLNSIRQMQEV